MLDRDVTMMGNYEFQCRFCGVAVNIAYQLQEWCDIGKPDSPHDCLAILVRDALNTPRIEVPK
jgi:hypothetical protein